MNIARKPPCRLDLLFAAKAPRAVVLRRGPSRWVRMVVWHTNTDQFVDGEWWRGRIYAEKSGLSPDGQLLVYFGYQWKPRYLPDEVFAFTAVSRPPEFRPWALWPADSFWGGGGSFLGPRRVVLNYGNSCLPQAHRLFHPHGLEVNGHSETPPHSAPNSTFRLDPAELPGAEWLGKDQRGRLVFTRAGGMYRVVGKREILVRDFNPDLPPSK